MSHRSLWLAILAALALVATPLAVLVHREYASSQKLNGPGRVLRFAGKDWGYPSPFQFYPRGPGYMQMSLLFDTLTWKDEEGLTGLLARSWTVSPDGKTYTFVLRPGVCWHDGVALTARDVAFSVRYLREHAFTWADVSVVADARAVDDRTVAIELHRPHAPFLVDIAGAIPILPAHIWEKVEDPRRFGGEAAVLGSGPFKLERYSKSHGTYSYVANETYFLGRPRVDRLEYVAAGDSLLALKEGEIHALSLWASMLDAVPEFRGDPRFQVLEGPGNWMLRLVFNHADADLSSRDVREAFALAIDLGEIAERLRHGHVVPGSPGVLPPDSPWRNPHIPPCRPDLARARARVRAAGVGRRTFTLLATPQYVREADYVASQAGRAGIAVAVKALPPTTADALLREGRFELAIDGHGGIGGDPDVLRKQFCTAGGGSSAGSSPISTGRTYGYANPELDELGRAQLREADPEARRAIVHKMQEIIAHDIPTVVLWHPKMAFVYRPEVLDGWFYSPGGLAGGIPLATNKLALIDRRPSR